MPSPLSGNSVLLRAASLKIMKEGKYTEEGERGWDDALRCNLLQSVWGWRFYCGHRQEACDWSVCYFAFAQLWPSAMRTQGL